MKRHRQGHRTGLGKSIHHGHDARGRDRHPPARQTVGVVIEHELERRQDRIEIQQRLAHAHHHHIGHWPLQQPVGHVQLTNDFSGREVSSKALMARGAETAVDGAAGLRRDAQGAAIVLGNKDGLDGIGLSGIEQPFSGAIGGCLVRQDRQGANLGHGGQAHSERLGQIGHVLEIGGA